jgi:hypothetical protein
MALYRYFHLTSIFLFWQIWRQNYLSLLKNLKKTCQITKRQNLSLERQHFLVFSVSNSKNQSSNLNRNLKIKVSKPKKSQEFKDLQRLPKRMSPTAKKAKYDSAVDDVISVVRRSFFGKPVDDEFLTDLKSLMETKMIAAGQYIIFY